MVEWIAVTGAVCLGSLVFGYRYGTAKARKQASLERAHLEQVARDPTRPVHRGPTNIDQPPSRVVRGRMRQMRRNWSR